MATLLLLGNYECMHNIDLGISNKIMYTSTKQVLFCFLQKQVETAQEVLERAAKKGLMKPGKTKTPRVPVEKSKHVHGVPTGSMAKLSVKAESAAVISDSEADHPEPIADNDSKPRSWHGSNENLTPKQSKTKLKKKSERNFKF